MPQSVPNRLFKRATLPLKQYKYSYFFIVVKRIILEGLILESWKMSRARIAGPVHFFTLTGAFCCESMKTDRFARTVYH